MQLSAPVAGESGEAGVAHRYAAFWSIPFWSAVYAALLWGPLQTTGWSDVCRLLPALPAALLVRHGWPLLAVPVLGTAMAALGTGPMAWASLLGSIVASATVRLGIERLRREAALQSAHGVISLVLLVACASILGEFVRGSFDVSAFTRGLWGAWQTTTHASLGAFAGMFLVMPWTILPPMAPGTKAFRSVQWWVITGCTLVIDAAIFLPFQGQEWSNPALALLGLGLHLWIASRFSLREALVTNALSAIALLGAFERAITVAPSAIAGGLVNDAWAYLVALQATTLGLHGTLAQRDHSRRQVGAMERRFRAIFDQAALPMLLFEPDGRMSLANAAWHTLWGVPLGTPMNYNIFQDPGMEAHGQRALVERAFAGEPVTGPVIQYQISNPAVSPQPVPHDIRWWISPVVSDDGEVVQLILVQLDLTEQIAAERELAHIALHDTLTGLPNRTYLLRTLEGLRHRLEQLPEEGTFAILFLDLDRFKIVNDTLGHAVGDGLLQQVAERLLECAGPNDVVGRLAGDEFVVLHPCQFDDASPLQLAQSIVRALTDEFWVDGNEVRVGTSVGVVRVQPGRMTSEDLLRDADLAMYEAKKERSGSRIRVFDPSLHASSLRRMLLEGGLRKAIERGELFLEYQPVFDLESRRIHTFEALVRWNHPTQGLLSPAEFLPIAEETGMIIPLGELVLHQASAFAARLAKVTCPTKVAPSVSVNLSPRQFAHVDLMEILADNLERHGIQSSALRLEITEESFLANDSFAAHNIRLLNECGFRVDIDDFGVGYSSLAMLARVPLSALKVDRSFVAGLPHDQAMANLVKAILEIAAAPGFEVIVEGVETLDQLAWLRQQGCRYVQGYLLSPPVSETTALAFAQGDGWPVDLSSSVPA